MVEGAVHRPAVQRVSVERGRVWQRLFGMRQSVVMMTRIRLIGRLLGDAVSSSSAASSRTFNSSVHLRADPCADLSVGLVCVGGAYCVPQVPVSKTFQGEGLVEAPGRLLQLCILGGGQLWWAGGQQVGVWVWLDGRQRRIMGICLALLHGKKGATGLGASDFDSSLVSRVTAAGGRGSGGQLGGGPIVEQLLVGCDWLLGVGH